MQQIAERGAWPGQRRRSWLVTGLLGLLILAYTVFFSAYSLQRHASLNTYAADLSFIDQPMWNTLHGRFLERTLGDRQVPRVAEHLELILLPLSLVYLVWDDVRAMLIVQTVVLAAGALPVFWIARHLLSGAGQRETPRHESPAALAAGAGAGREISGSQSEWMALAFAATYLLFPALQAANVADFHADPLAVTPFLFAFWYALRRRWGPMWAWALLVMAAKENLPSLTAMLGLYVVLADGNLRAALRTRGSLWTRARASLGGGAGHGLALVAVSAAWLYIATFLIVAPLARSVYGTEGPVYLASRFAAFEGGPAALIRGAVAALREPARIDYLAGLLASVGWLAILAPEYLLLGLPVLVANTFSSFPGQFSGEQHYSAPLVPVFVVAAVFGARRLRALMAAWMPFRLSGHFASSVLAGGVIALWLLGWAGAQQLDRGWTPLSRVFRWPAVTSHHRMLDRFASQIPEDASLSASPAVHAHLAHRHKAYVFPELSDAAYVLVDVAGVTDMHPADVKATLEGLVGSRGFAIVDAADGYALLVRGSGNAAWPDEFYDFARADDPRPQQVLDLRFGGGLRLLGYDVSDDPRWRLTRLRYYWRVDKPLAKDTSIIFQVRSPGGAIADSSDVRPMPAMLWYPPASWQAGETVVTESVPWFLPGAWAPALSASAGGVPLPAETVLGESGERAAEVSAEGWARLPAWVRRNGLLRPLDGPGEPVEEAEARYSAEGWSVRLVGWAAPLAGAPGRRLPVTLRWQADGPAPNDFSVFLHLRDVSGRTMALGDGQPTWFLPRPAPTWSAPEVTSVGIWDAHELELPVDLPDGRYDLVVGWYDWRSGGRLSVTDGTRNSMSSEFVLGPVTIDVLAAPRPDACCLMAAECCNSLEADR